MDDALETPHVAPPKVSVDGTSPDEDDQSSEDEEGVPDWTKLLPAASRPVIPKRGEKEFEPRAGGGSNLQLHVLDRSRSAMLEALRATRTTSSKTMSYAIWYPHLARAHVTTARGIHFTSMGHSAPRSVVGDDEVEKSQKRLELLPEEAIYLIERGSLFCYKYLDVDLSKVSELHDILGSPMSVQQAYSEMIGTEDLTLEKFQVFSYLRRLGFVVTRTDPPNSWYPTPCPRTEAKAVHSILNQIWSIFSQLSHCLKHFIGGGFNWWRPVRFTRWLYHDKNYGSLFRSLRFMPSGHGIQLHSPKEISEVKKGTTPYKIFYNLYKPATAYKKSNPPQPDFQIVVINARTTPMPTLQELSDLFDILPEIPTPLPRQRQQLSMSQIQASDAATETTPATDAAKPSVSLEVRRSTFQAQPYKPHFNRNLPSISLFQRLFPWAIPTPPAPGRRPNPFMALKAGKKIAIVAAVDSGSISFFRFGQGAFTEWPMMG